jgi:hypothetical protein
MKISTKLFCVKEEFQPNFSASRKSVNVWGNLLLNLIQYSRQTRHEQWDTSIKHDMQCTQNVTYRSVRTTIVVVENQLVLHILSVCL